MGDEVRVVRGRLALDDACVWADGGERIALSGTEVDLLRFLIAREGEVVTRQTLLEEVWGYAPQVVSRAVDSAIKRLRAKIDPVEPHANLLTVFGEGYRFLRTEAAGRVGRERFLVEVREALREGDVTLTGPAGCGKRSIARHLRATWGGGLRVVEPDAEVGDGPGPVLAIGFGPRVGRAMPVPPLDAAAVRRLLGEHAVPASEWVDALGGSPLAVHAVRRRLKAVDAVALGPRLRESLLRALPELAEAAARTWEGTPPHLREAWRRLAMLGSGFDAEQARDLVEVGSAELSALVVRGIAVEAGVGWRVPGWLASFADGMPEPPGLRGRIRARVLERVAPAPCIPGRLALAPGTLEQVWRDGGPDADLARVFAVRLRRSGHADRALSMLDAVEPTAAVSLERVACLVELGRAEQALEALDAVEGPTDPDTAVMGHVWRSRLGEALGDDGLRSAAAERAIGVDGARPEALATAHATLAEVRFAAGRMDEGLRHARVARGQLGPGADPTRGDLALARALRRVGRHDEALHLAERVARTGTRLEWIALAEGLSLRCRVERGDAVSELLERLDARWWTLHTLRAQVEVALSLAPLHTLRGDGRRAAHLTERLLQRAVAPAPRAHLRAWLAVALASTDLAPLSRVVARQVGAADPALAELVVGILDTGDPEALGVLRDLTWRL